jgi:phosphoribosylglycinamide formyltransferase-1
MNIRAGILGSSGGSALRAAVACLRDAGISPDIKVIVDRECGLERWALEEGFATTRLPHSTAHEFSELACQEFQGAGCDQVLLFYTRRVSAPLIAQCVVHNIHPSLLPAFAGLHGVRDALRGGARMLGATLHRVDATLDTGPIAAQVACALVGSESLQLAERLSFIQKVYLSLVWFDQLRTGAIAMPSPEAPCYAPAVTSVSAGLSDGAVAEAFGTWAANLEFADLTTLAAQA